MNKTKVVKLETNVIYNEDCLEGMKVIPDNSIDLIVTEFSKKYLNALPEEEQLTQLQMF
ncbi:MAG TPA: hypothetical protein PKI14_16165 [Fervidobacterium sp.]|nr:hypothetical protein [Fervidobacterium sp.]